MSQGDEFMVSLPSNVKGNDKNKTGEYETTLARPLDLPGTWEVALMDITYPHSWINVDKEFVVGISMFINRNEREEQANIIVDSKYMEFLEVLIGMARIPARLPAANNVPEDQRINRRTEGFYLKNLFTVVPGQYNITNLTAFIQEEIRKTGLGVERATVSYDRTTDRVTIKDTTRRMIISGYSSSSILDVLGFGKQTRTTDQVYRDSDMEVVPNLSLPKLEYMQVITGHTVEAKKAPVMQRLSSIYVYTDIVDDVLVGNTQAPLLGYFPVLSKYGSTSYFNMNPPYYIRVKESNVRTIVIKLCTDTGEVIEFEDGTVTCRLHFRRVGMLRGYF